jgi:hypothetical protein
MAQVVPYPAVISPAGWYIHGAAQIRRRLSFVDNGNSGSAETRRPLRFGAALFRFVIIHLGPRRRPCEVGLSPHRRYAPFKGWVWCFGPMRRRAVSIVWRQSSELEWQTLGRGSAAFRRWLR